MCENTGTLLTCGGSAELFLPDLLQLQDLLQGLRDLWADTHFLTLPRLRGRVGG